MNPCPYELETTTRLHRQALRREAERERLLVSRRHRRVSGGQLLARAGRLLIAVGNRLEARYADPAPAVSANGGPSYR